MPGDHHDHLALQRSRSALRHMWYGDVQEKLPLPWPDAGVYGSGYWPTMQQLNFHLCGTNSECPGLRLNHGERVRNECVLSPAVSVGGNRVGGASTPPPAALGRVLASYTAADFPCQGVFRSQEPSPWTTLRPMW